MELSAGRGGFDFLQHKFQLAGRRRLREYESERVAVYDWRFVANDADAGNNFRIFREVARGFDNGDLVRSATVIDSYRI